MKQIIEILKGYNVLDGLIEYLNKVNKVKINKHIKPDDYIKLVKMRFIEFLSTKTSLNEMPSVSNKDEIYDIRIV